MHTTDRFKGCPARRGGPPWRQYAGFTWRLAVIAITLAAAAQARPAAGQVLVSNLQPVSMQFRAGAQDEFRAGAQDGIRAHQSQIRARQARVRQTKSSAGLPRLANDLSMSGDNGSIPLRLRDTPPVSAGFPGPKKIAPSSVGVINSFIRGDLHTEADGGTGSGLSTSDFTAGADYKVGEDMMFGLAAGRLHRGAATGATISAYLTLQPFERVSVDMSLSYGAHRARAGGAAVNHLPLRVAVEGVSRSFSMTMTHPRRVGDWYWSPYSRYDRILTDVDGHHSMSVSTPPITHGLSAISLGSTAATNWATPFGEVRPMVTFEVQKEVITVAGLGTTASQTVGVVGIAMTTRVSRDMSAFAQSRYQSDLAATLDRQMMLGVKFGF